jgi:hypothetical protein
VAVASTTFTDPRPLSLSVAEVGAAFTWSSVGLASSGSPYWKRVYRLSFAGRPVPGARLYLIDTSSNSVITSVTTGEDGSATFYVPVGSSATSATYAVSMFPKHLPFDNLFTDVFKVKVYVNTMHIYNVNDCWARFFGRTINVDPLTYDQAAYPSWWAMNPAFVLGILWGTTTVVDVIPVMDGVSVTAYYDNESTHWYWHIDANVTDGSSTWSYGMNVGNTCFYRDPDHLAVLCPNQDNSGTAHLLKAVYSIDGVQLSEWSARAPTTTCCCA